MPKVKDTCKVEVDESTDGEHRTIVVTVTASVQDFMLADLLRQRGAVSGIDAPLKQAVRETVLKYLDEAEALIAGVAGQKKAARQPRKTATEVVEPGAENGTSPPAVESGAEGALSQ